ncbi:MAG: signal peptidase II [Actinobacteria bacterium]|uniref:Unannotated protein n=1 Tax=freshwater metagenome TaxID=449393 RepID=A0A6J7QWQ4_9ZZZZ|nr:signal peptidase II [Actinomycetota bacterium]
MHGVQTERRTALNADRVKRARKTLALCAFSVFLIDFLSKLWAVENLKGRDSIKVIGNFLQLTYTTNSGAAFSMAPNATLALASFALCVAAFIIYFSRKVISIWWGAALGLVLGGIFGNLWDRIFKAPGRFQGHVVDWIELPHWPIFNVADSAICIAAGIVVILAIKNIQPTASSNHVA